MKNIMLAHKSLRGTCPTDLQNKVEVITTSHQYMTRNSASSRHGIPAGSIKISENNKSYLWESIVKAWNNKLKEISTCTLKNSNTVALNSVISFQNLNLTALMKILKEYYISL